VDLFDLENGLDLDLGLENGYDVLVLFVALPLALRLFPLPLRLRLLPLRLSRPSLRRGRDLVNGLELLVWEGIPIPIPDLTLAAFDRERPL